MAPMELKPLFVAAVGLIGGYALWMQSEVLTGALQPWDASSPVYLVCLFAAGAVLGAIERKHLWVGPLALYFGQALAYAVGPGYYIEHPPPPPVKEWLFLVSYTLPAMPGAALAAAILTWKAPLKKTTGRDGGTASPAGRGPSS
jgi:hypothetical protein